MREFPTGSVSTSFKEIRNKLRIQFPFGRYIQLLIQPFSVILYRVYAQVQPLRYFNREKPE